MSSVMFVPEFPQPYSQFNFGVVDYGSCGLISYCTGNLIYFSYIKKGQLCRCSSFSIQESSTISCVKYHPTKRLIAVGDIKGEIFFVEIDDKKITKIKNKRNKISDNSSAVVGMQWRNDVLIVLLSSKRKSKLIAIKDKETLWKKTLNNNYNRIDICPFDQNYILLSCESPELIIYKWEVDNLKPEPLELVQLELNKEIKSIQWCRELPGYILVLLKDEVLFYHVLSKKMIVMVPKILTCSTFEFMLQMPNDPLKLMVFLKNGGISIFKMKNNGCFDLIQDSQPYCSNGCIIGAVCSPFNNNYIIVFHSSFGLGLYDLNVNRLTSFDFTFPSMVTTFDCDGTKYAIGTNDGFIIVGNLYDSTECKRFRIISTPISFISFDALGSRIFWQSNDNIGIVYIASCKVEQYSSKSLGIIRCFGSHRGSLIVQRDLQILGIIINGIENPLILNSEIIDVNIDDINSDSCSGSFCVLLKNLEIRFYEYSNQKGVFSALKGFKPRGINLKPVCFTKNGSIFVTGFSNGLLIFHDSETKETKELQTGISNLKLLMFSETLKLYGLSKDGKLFEYDKDLRICPYNIKYFNIVENDYILSMFQDNSVKFIRTYDWSLIFTFTDYCPIPKENDLLYEFISNKSDNSQLYFNPKVSDLWECLINNNNIRLQALYGIGKNSLYEQINYNLLQKIEMNNNTIHMLKFLSLLFLDKFEEASNLTLNKYNIDDTRKYFESTILFATIVQMQNKADEKTLALIKNTAISLFEAQKFEEGSILLRLGRLDRIAVSSLIDYGKDKLAIRFIRSCLNENDKIKYSFRLGCKKVATGELIEGIPFFASAKEFHPVLQILYDMKMVCDSYYIMKYLKEKNLIFELDNSKKELLSMNLMDVNDLCTLIDKRFISLTESLNI